MIARAFVFGQRGRRAGGSTLRDDRRDAMLGRRAWTTARALGKREEIFPIGSTAKTRWFATGGDGEDAVREANAALDDVFFSDGRVADAAAAGSSSSSAAESRRLTHVDATTGAATMVDVGLKTPTRRTATASARVTLGDEAFALVRENKVKKGDVLAAARLAGIIGAKKTHDLIPLCHALALDSVKIDLRMNEEAKAVDVFATATCSGKTGVEMEALTAVTVSGLTIYDMCKAVSKDIVIGDVRLEAKYGGKSGDWKRGGEV